MAALEKTRHPGIYKRGSRYAITFRDGNGKQRWESTRSLEEARKIKAAREAGVASGEWQAASRATLHGYAAEWIERYQGRGRGFRDSTRGEYRTSLRLYALRYFGKRKRLAQVGPRDVAQFVAWVADEREQGRRLSDATVRNAVKPLQSLYATAVAEGLVRHNPCSQVPFPSRERVKRR
jgi:hypothetical protein